MASMIEVHDGKIEKFVEQNRIDVVVNAARPSLMGAHSAGSVDYAFLEIIYVFLTIFLYLLKCPQSLILSALRAFCFCGKPHISRSIFLYFRYQTWLKSW